MKDNKMNTNQKYIIRTYSAGVFYAEITDRRGSEADLKDARRIYSWSGAATLSQVAMDGISTNSKVTMAVPTMTVLGVIEVIPCSEKATKNLDEQKEWKL